MSTPNRLTKGEAIVASLLAEETVTARAMTSASITAHDAALTQVRDVDTIDFDVLAAAPDAAGRIRWDDTAGTAVVGLKGGVVKNPVGSAQLIQVKSATGGGLLKGQVVYFVGADGSNKTVGLASASVEAQSVDVLGVMAETVTGGNKGWLATFGLIDNINTAALTEGSVVWLSASPGLMTTIKPAPPFHGVQVGFCLRSQQNAGSVFVSVQNGYELDELHNVAISNPQDGDVLTWSASAAVWRNRQP